MSKEGIPYGSLVIHTLGAAGVSDKNGGVLELR